MGQTEPKRLPDGDDAGSSDLPEFRPPSSLRFVLVGSGRSGTRYAATVFSQLGIPCGHEAVFGWGKPANLVPCCISSSPPWPVLRPAGVVAPPRSSPATPTSARLASEPEASPNEGRNLCNRALIGDASFCAAPFLAGFSGTVFHQVRNPLAVLCSIIATGFFADPGQYTPHLRLIERSLPGIKRRETPLLKAMYFIVKWNRMCEPVAKMRWRVEALDAPTLRQAAHLAGFTRSLAECDSVLQTVDRSINRLEQRGLRRIQLAWRDIPDSPEKADLVQMATSYGY